MREAVYLRYGTEVPVAMKTPPPLLTMQTVADLMKLRLSQVASLMKLYFKSQPVNTRKSISPPKLWAKASKKSKVTLGNATLEEIEYIIAPHHQTVWAHISLLGRCILFHRRFHDRRIDRWTISRIMRRAGLKKKAIRVSKIARRRTMRIDEFEDKILALDD